MMMMGVGGEEICKAETKLHLSLYSVPECIPKAEIEVRTQVRVMVLVHYPRAEID